MGKRLLQHPWRGLQGGSAPCVELFVFDELKINSFRPFFSQNILKIHLKNTKKKWVGPIFWGGKGYSYPPHTNTPKIVGASDEWVHGGIFEIHLAGVGSSKIFHYHWLSFFPSFSFSFSFLLSFSFFFLLSFFWGGPRMQGASAPEAPHLDTPMSKQCLYPVWSIQGLGLFDPPPRRPERQG